MTPEACAADLAARALIISDLRIWGHAPFRPGDQAWRVTARAAAGGLQIWLHHTSGEGSPLLVDVEAPEGVRVGPGGVAVDAAARIRLGVLDAALDGDDVVTLGPRGETRRPRPPGPALTLGQPPEPP
ncbi:MAG TPA: hypothetical protein PKA64_11670 [Myxococcota bacterium]|nr:hypothetical protein [Myxococcota bacterium]